MGKSYIRSGLPVKTLYDTINSLTGLASNGEQGPIDIGGKLIVDSQKNQIRVPEGTDFIGTIDNTKKFGHQPPNYYAAKEDVSNEFNNVKASNQVFNFTVTNSWTSRGGFWQQTCACSGMSSAYDCQAPWFKKTGNKAVDDVAQEVFGQISRGYCATQNGSILITIYEEPIQLTQAMEVSTRRTK